MPCLFTIPPYWPNHVKEFARQAACSSGKLSGVIKEDPAGLDNVLDAVCQEK
jgi:hypothetical protein